MTTTQKFIGIPLAIVGVLLLGAYAGYASMSQADFEGGMMGGGMMHGMMHGGIFDRDEVV
jgi:hypothetical protein